MPGHGIAKYLGKSDWRFRQGGPGSSMADHEARGPTQPVQPETWTDGFGSYIETSLSVDSATPTFVFCQAFVDNLCRSKLSRQPFHE